MGHIHSIYDTDPHFAIDPITRAITNQSSTKTTIMQNDHNSERFTFEMPRFIEEHDMSLCNKIQVHYINIGDSGRRSNGVYEVTDMQLSPEDENIIICSWLISGNATQLVGPLTFVLRFICMTDNIIDYVWHTAVYSGINIGTSINNSEEIVTQYADVLMTWYKDIVEAGEAGISKIENAADEAIDRINSSVSDEIEHEKEAAIETIHVQADEIIKLVLERLPRAEEASF